MADLAATFADLGIRVVSIDHEPGVIVVETDTSELDTAIAKVRAAVENLRDVWGELPRGIRERLRMDLVLGPDDEDDADA